MSVSMSVTTTATAVATSNELSVYLGGCSFAGDIDQSDRTSCRGGGRPAPVSAAVAAE